ncbi:MAG: hypothetical protein RSD26_09170 [Cellulosilyticaceae bacterium]
MKRYIVCLGITITTLLCLIGCSNRESKKDEMTPVKDEWALEQSTGAEMVTLDFASEEKVIFHGYFGLFVYDLSEEKITHSLDLKSIGCDSTQGDSYCEVSVSQEADVIQLHPMNNEKMYVYDIENNILRQTPYEHMENRFKTIPNENPHGVVSYETVRFPNGDIGYLEDKNATLDSLYFVVGDKEYKLFTSR